MGLEIICLDHGRYVLAGLILLHPVLGLFRDSTGARSRLLGRKIAASVDGNDKDKKNFSGIQFNRFFLCTQFGSVYLYTARHPSVNPALLQLALWPNSTTQVQSWSRVFGTSFVSHNMVLRVTLP